MKIEIWSDLVCPWCYIGKRRLEKALEKFEHADKVELEFKSYQLNPGIQTDVETSSIDYLVNNKGITKQQAKQMTLQVTEIAAKEGLTYQLENNIALNTLKAHRLLHLAKESGKQNQLEEALFHAYFSEAENIDDHATLFTIGLSVGLKEQEIQRVLSTDVYSSAVQHDIQEGIQIGLKGVPFFVFDRKYGISGAESTQTFLETLEKVLEESQLVTTE